MTKISNTFYKNKNVPTRDWGAECTCLTSNVLLVDFMLQSDCIKDMKSILTVNFIITIKLILFCYICLKLLGLIGNITFSLPS
jgi:hypothetical protein